MQENKHTAIEYFDIEAQLLNLLIISDMALNDGEINSLCSTLSIINQMIRQLLTRLEERAKHDR